MNYLKAMFWTGITAFVSTFVPTAMGWLTNVQSSGHLDSPSVLRSAAISAGAAAVMAIITAGSVGLRQQSWFPGTPPVYPGNPVNPPGGNQ